MVGVTKSGQSPIVATVLLILIVLIAAFVVVSFVVPFVQNNLSGSECFALADSVKINEGRYTCFNASSDEQYVHIRLKETDAGVGGFQIVIAVGGSSSSFTVEEGSADPGVTMYGGGIIELPGENEERTYSITGFSSVPDSIYVYPLKEDGTSCDTPAATTNVGLCVV